MIYINYVAHGVLLRWLKGPLKTGKHYSTPANTVAFSPLVYNYREQVVVDLHAAVKEGNISRLEESLHGDSNCDILMKTWWAN